MTARSWYANCSVAFGMRWKKQIRKLKFPAGVVGTDRADDAGKRLVLAFGRIQGIQVARERRQDPLFGRAEEERTVWRELLELELQAIDEEIDRITTNSGSIAERWPDASESF